MLLGISKRFLKSVLLPPLQSGVEINWLQKTFLQSQVFLICLSFRALSLKLLREVKIFLEIVTTYLKTRRLTVIWRFCSSAPPYHKIHSKQPWQCFKAWKSQGCLITGKLKSRVLLTLKGMSCSHREKLVLPIISKRSTKAIDLSSSNVWYYGYVQYKYDFKFSSELNKITP